jgi:RAD51-like protein 2
VHKLHGRRRGLRTPVRAHARYAHITPHPPSHTPPSKRVAFSYFCSGFARGEFPERARGIGAGRCRSIVSWYVPTPHINPHPPTPSPLPPKPPFYLAHVLTPHISSAEAGLAHADAAQVWAEVQEGVEEGGRGAGSGGEGAEVGSVRGGARSALELLKTSGTRGVVTFVAEVDRMLGGGVALGQVTEVVGVPGVGKTQLCMQLAVDVQIPRSMGGVEGTAVYVDTEGSMVPARLLQVAEAMCEHLRRVADKAAAAGLAGAEEQGRAVRGLTAEGVLDRIVVVRCTDAATLVATCAGLGEMIVERYPATKLVVVDTVAFPFRQTLDARVRSAGLVSVARDLKRVAATLDVAVVVVNQMTSSSTSTAAAPSSFSSSSSSSSAAADDDEPPPPSGPQIALVPALGPAWAHEVDHRLLLHFAPGGDVRLAKLVKSTARPEGVAAFAVCDEGLRRPPAIALADAAGHYRP